MPPIRRNRQQRNRVRHTAEFVYRAALAAGFNFGTNGHDTLIIVPPRNLPPEVFRSFEAAIHARVPELIDVIVEACITSGSGSGES